MQLRQDDLKKNFFQLVGFQTRLKHGDQKRIFRTLPGLENAEFERFGRMHRNTYINAPLILNPFSQCKKNSRIYFAGQISGVEGYVESVASGLLCGLFASRAAQGAALRTAAGNHGHRRAAGLHRPCRLAGFPAQQVHIRSAGRQPAWRCRDKKRKKELKAERAGEALEQWIKKSAI